jgi:Na+/phosphate symporter
MDNIRKAQINDVLDYDKNINAMVYNLTKSQVARLSENVLPYVQLNVQAMDGAKAVINILLIAFEKKQAQLRFILQNQDKWNTAEYSQNISEVGMIEEVMQQWNRIVSYYNLNNNTLQTKSAIITNARKLLDYTNFISKGLYQLIESIIQEYSRSGVVNATSPLGQFITKYFSSLC